MNYAISIKFKLYFLNILFLVFLAFQINRTEKSYFMQYLVYNLLRLKQLVVSLICEYPIYSCINYIVNNSII